MKINFTEETFKLLKEYCEAHGITTREAVRRILTDALVGEENANEELFTDQE